VILQATHRAAQHHRLRCHQGIPCRHHLPRSRQQAGSQDPYQSERAWLEHLSPDLVRVFEGNFQGTYVRPGNSWDLRSCRQKPDEALREYIR
jgi:hypothetical protein